MAPATPEQAERIYLRFDGFNRWLHVALMISFLTLAATGLPLLFNDEHWARMLSNLFGGFVVAGVIHRMAAVLMIAVFILHLGRLGHRLFVRSDLSILWGPESMTPQPRDVVEFVQHVRWFLRLGPRPAFDHFTYWEKFDYWAVFWGMGIIGGSGLLLWFPEFFAWFLPGWAFNIAMLIHGEEALLAVGFIFTIHFFNSHLRPEKFPMDLVIFTGRVSDEEMRHERTAEYARLAAGNRLEALVVRPARPAVAGRGRIGGTVAVVVGLSLVTLILFAWLT